MENCNDSAITDSSDKMTSSNTEDRLNVEKVDDATDKKEEKQDKEKSASPLPHLISAQFPVRTCSLDYHRYGALKGLQAIVLAAGTGSRMTTLVTSTQKCMLPIATIPMLYFPLHMLQRAGFTECIVVVSSGSEEAVTAMAQDYGLSIRLDLHAVDAAEDSGTLDAIRHIAADISVEAEDVLIVSSDIVSDINITEMFKNHRYKGAALTMLTTDSNTKSFVPTPGLKQKSTIGPDVIMESMSERVLTNSVCGGDYDEMIEVPYSQHCRGTVMACMNVIDAHVYILQANVLHGYILSDTSPCSGMTSLKAEVVPHLITQQYRANPHPEYRAARERVPDPFSRLQTSYNGGVCRGQRSGASHSFHYDGGFCVRANTIPAYWHLNRKMPELLSTLCPDCPVRVNDTSQCDVGPKALIRGQNVLGSGCTLSDRTTITDSSVGRGCSVPPTCRLTNTVLMDGVELQPGSVLESCLVCCTIDKEKCTLKNCIVASSRALHPNQTVVGDTLECTQFFST